VEVKEGTKFSAGGAMTQFRYVTCRCQGFAPLKGDGVAPVVAPPAAIAAERGYDPAYVAFLERLSDPGFMAAVERVMKEAGNGE